MPLNKAMAYAKTYTYLREFKVPEAEITTLAQAMYKIKNNCSAEDARISFQQICSLSLAPKLEGLYDLLIGEFVLEDLLFEEVTRISDSYEQAQLIEVALISRSPLSERLVSYVANLPKKTILNQEYVKKIVKNAGLLSHSREMYRKYVDHPIIGEALKDIDARCDEYARRVGIKKETV